MRRLLIGALILSAAAGVVSCGGSSTTPAVRSDIQSKAMKGPVTIAELKKAAASCYNSGGLGGSTHTVSATVTFYGWFDNSPPGAGIAHPVIHSTAGGDGSYCNPTTFATEPTSSENSRFPYGVVLYVPLVDKYFIREDDCTNSGPSSGSGSQGCTGIWFDLWIGGDASSNKTALFNCEDSLTPSGKVNVIVDPPSTETVNWLGPIYSDSLGCNKGGTSPTPTPTSSPTSKPTSSPTSKPTSSPTTKPTTSPTASPTSSPTGTTTADILWYDYFQNGDSCAVADPNVSCAGGTGTYSSPITFAAPTSDNSTIPYGTILYLPSMKKYFVRQDDCGSNCSNSTTFVLWIGGNSSDTASDMLTCEKYLDSTYLKNPSTQIILNPPSNEPVTSGQIWNESNGDCDGTSNY